MSANRETWLANLAAGDAAVVERGYSYTNLEIRTVDRVTATQVLIGNMRFCRKRGYLKGQTTRCTPICLSEPTPSNLDRAFRQKAVASLSGVNWDRLPSDSLKQICDIVDEFKKSIERPGAAQ